MKSTVSIYKIIQYQHHGAAPTSHEVVKTEKERPLPYSHPHAARISLACFLTFSTTVFLIGASISKLLFIVGALPNSSLF